MGLNCKKNSHFCVECHLEEIALRLNELESKYLDIDERIQHLERRAKQNGNK
jgi:hypothetical protein